MKRLNRILWLGALLVLSLAPVMTPATASPEQDPCPAIVLQALDTTDQLCADTDRNEACYGHVFLDARPQPQIERFNFDQEGDIVGVEDVQTLRLSKMNIDSEVWGVALMRLQASLPDTSPRQNVTLLLFGDVEIENAGAEAAPTLLDVTVEATDNVNVRSRPMLGAEVIGQLAPEQTVTASGRLADDSWLRVQLDTGQTGWVAGWLMASADGFEALDVVEASSRHYGPMQAFYFQSGMDDAACPEAPSSGILIQTPEGVGEVTFLINEVDIQLGSTVYFQAAPGAEMRVSVVEGSATVTTPDGTSKAPAGAQVVLPIDEHMAPAGAPSAPRAYDMTPMQVLPVSLLPRTIEIVAPLSEDELAALEAEDAVTATGEASETDESGETESDEGEAEHENSAGFDPDALPPGQDPDFVPPGEGGTPPGQDPDFTPPGQGKKDK